MAQSFELKPNVHVPASSILAIDTSPNVRNSWKITTKIGEIYIGDSPRSMQIRQQLIDHFSSLHGITTVPKTYAQFIERGLEVDFTKLYPMDLCTNFGESVIFMGLNGYDHDLSRACEKLVVGDKYIVDSLSVGQSSSTVKLKGIDGKFNTVMFTNATDTYEKFDWFKYQYSTF